MNEGGREKSGGCDENKEWRGAGSMREGEEGCWEYEGRRGWRGVGSMREGEEWGCGE